MKVLLSASVSRFQDSSQGLQDSLDLSMNESAKQMQIEPDTDLNILVQALMSELALLRKQLSKRSAADENQRLDIEQMLECIQLMKVQFRYNREQYYLLEKEHKATLINLSVTQQTLKQYESEFADKQRRIIDLENQLRNEQLQVKELTEILRKRKQQEDLEETAMTNQMLIQLQQLQLDYEHQKKAKSLESKCDELTKQNLRYQKQLQELQKQMKCNALDTNVQSNENMSDIIQSTLEIECPKCKDMEFQLQLERQNASALQQRVEILQSQLNRYLDDPKNQINKLDVTEKMLKSIQQEADSLKAEVQTLEQERQQFATQHQLIDELQGKVEQLTRELEDKFREIDDFGIQNESLEEAVRALRNELGLLAQQNVFLTAVYETHKLASHAGPQQTLETRPLQANEDAQNVWPGGQTPDNAGPPDVTDQTGAVEPSILAIKAAAESALEGSKAAPAAQSPPSQENYIELLQLEINLLREKAGIFTIAQGLL